MKNLLTVPMAVLMALPLTAAAHGFAGDRFFPPTLQTDDPFATDELAFPSITTLTLPSSGGNPPIRQTSFGAEFDKEIFPHFAIGLAEDYIDQSPRGGSSTSGFDNISVSLKYEVWINAPHEAIFSIGGEWEVGRTGSQQIGADHTSTFTPTLYFGKGFGDLPDSVKYFRPFALTGTIGETLAVAADPNDLEWGLALEYSMPYLHSQVRELGLPRFFNHLIPLVEFAMESPENRHGGGTTGTINPGVLYENNYFQVGLEATLPVNGASATGIGGIFQIQIYIDDLFPGIFGFPIFGQKP